MTPTFSHAWHMMAIKQFRSTYNAQDDNLAPPAASRSLSNDVGFRQMSKTVPPGIVGSILTAPAQDSSLEYFQRCSFSPCSC